MKSPSKILIAVFCLVSVLYLSPAEAAQKKRIVFFAPSTENNTYWPQVYKVLDAVSEDLDIEIERYEFNVDDRYAKHLNGVQILEQKPIPDAAIFSVAFGNTKPLLEAAERLQIPVFIQGPVFPSELPDIGFSPRVKYKQWIGYFYQDESEKGYILGKTLIKAAREAGAFAADGKIHVVGVGGDFTWFGSELRKEGLIRAVQKDHSALLRQVVPTLWTPKEGKKITASLLKRYPEVSVVWAASDQLGIGALEALEESGRIIGKTGFVGGLDFSVVGIAHVKNRKFVATVASSVLAYAEIVVYLYDYIHGIDFAAEVGTEISTDLYTAHMDDGDYRFATFNSYRSIDFKSLSKTHNVDLAEYDFSLERILTKEK